MLGESRRFSCRGGIIRGARERRQGRKARARVCRREAGDEDGGRRPDAAGRAAGPSERPRDDAGAAPEGCPRRSPRGAEHGTRREGDEHRRGGACPRVDRIHAGGDPDRALRRDPRAGRGKSPAVAGAVRSPPAGLSPSGKTLPPARETSRARDASAARADVDRETDAPGHRAAARHIAGAGARRCCSTRRRLRRASSARATVRRSDRPSSCPGPPRCRRRR